jgi:hypothetical protein
MINWRLGNKYLGIRSARYVIFVNFWVHCVDAKQCWRIFENTWQMVTPNEAPHDLECLSWVSK